MGEIGLDRGPWDRSSAISDLSARSEKALAGLQVRRARDLVEEREAGLAGLELDDITGRAEIWRAYTNAIVALDAEFDSERTDRLLRQAETELVDPPAQSADGAWSEDVIWGSILTREGQLALRQKIQVARRSRSAEWRGWLASVAGLLGVVVAVLALVLKGATK